MLLPRNFLFFVLNQIERVVEYFVSLRNGSEKNQEPVKITISSFPDFGQIGASNI